ncbi:MAG: hypothetical protein ACRC2T_13565 [Thermoguttaceae bacterium]
MITRTYAARPDRKCCICKEAKAVTRGNLFCQPCQDELIWNYKRTPKPMLDVDELDEDEHPFVENNEPKIRLHFCDYGGAVPNPLPGPNPTPPPKPETLTEWVKENKPNIPDTAASALASCYQSAAEGIEKGTFKTQASAYSALRAATQTKIKPELWGEFLDKLEMQITEKLAGSTDTKKLGELFREVATGLNVTPSITETVDIPIIDSAKPLPTSADCATGVCPSTTPYIRRR